MAVLLDTSLLFSYYNSDDPNYPTARQVYPDILRGKYGQPFLLDYIFDELVTLVQSRTKSLAIAMEIGTAVMDTYTKQSPGFLQASGLVDRAWEVYCSQSAQRKGRYLSFTDSILVSCSRVLNIEYIASFDQLLHGYATVIP